MLDLLAAFGEVFRAEDLDTTAEFWLTQVERGVVADALSHPEVGVIALPWGEPNQGRRRGYGLAKIVKKHPEVLGRIGPLLNEMVILERTAEQIVLASATHRAVVNTVKTRSDGSRVGVVYLATLYVLRGG